MNFSEIEKIEKQAAVVAERDYYSRIFEDYIAKEQQREKVHENPFVYFYEDIIEDKISYDFKRVLGDATYKNASKDTQNCLSICDEFRRLSVHSTIEWLHSALKFVDNIVLHYIQDVCKEAPQQYKNMKIEESLYKQLSEKSGEIADVGKTLTELYVLHNEYRIKICPDGKRELFSLSKGSVRKMIMKKYPVALKMMLKMYKTI